MNTTYNNRDRIGDTSDSHSVVFETIAFFEKYERSPNDLCIVLDKFQVTPMLFHLTGSCLENIQRNLIEGEMYTPSELVGDENWGPWGGPWKREIELCLKHFANYPDFGLRATERGTFECVVGGRAA